MIIVLKSADFSENNIGTIQLNVPDHAETNVIAARYAGITSASKDNLNVFIDSLINAGIYSKLKYLMLPILANNVSDALQNVLTNDKEIISNTGYATLSSKGITFTGAGFLSLSPVIGNTQNNFSYGCAVVSVATPTSSTSERIVTLSDSSTVTSQFPRGYVDVAGSGAATLLFKAANETGAVSSPINNIVIHSINSGVLSYLSSDTQVSTYTLTGTPVVSALKLSGDKSSGYHQYLHSYAIRMFFIADALTDTQMVALHDAMETFIAAEA
jgi:hypothetical protein